MSEVIDNQARRKETLKRLIGELHEGKTVEEVQAEFARLLRDVGATEIAEIEQALIDEGLPETEVKRLCDVHVAVFRESLDAQPNPESRPGHPLHTFRAENEAVVPVLDALRASLEALKRAPGPDRLQEARERLGALQVFEKHYVRKENILFPFLEKHGFMGPSSVMWAIHDDVRAAWKTLGSLLGGRPGSDPAAFAARVDEVFEPLSTALSEMIYKEEKILFPTALEKLSAAEWVEIRTQEAAVGYCYVEPGSQWPEEGLPSATEVTMAPGPSPEPEEADRIPLDTGALTAQQIDLVLGHLPVDITYVDKNDAVRYFSPAAKQIFGRAPAVIGRQVQKCHPPASVHRVQQILDAFHSGTRDVAEFWLQKQPGDRFIYIRYFAVRDPAGAYQGTLEVVQDVTDIRALQGERRLLDEEE